MNVSGYQPIENYGIIGNMRTVALVGMNGSIDWFCAPNFDSPSIFGAIRDDGKGGRFRIAPSLEGVRSKQFYWPDTAILITRFFHANGVGEVEDYMPIGPPGSVPNELIRRVRVVHGNLPFSPGVPACFRLRPGAAPMSNQRIQCTIRCPRPDYQPGGPCAFANGRRRCGRGFHTKARREGHIHHAEWV